MQIEEVFPLITYINMDHRKDRDEQVNLEFKKLEISPTRVSGKIYRGTDNPNWNGIAGCTLSHITCLNMAVEKKCNILIFEDDVKFINDYKNVISSALDELKNLEWSLWYMGGNLLKPIYQVTDHLGKLTWCQSTVAYGVNANFVQRLIHYIPNQIMPIDLVYTNYVIPNNNCYMTVPMVAVQRNSYSDIEGVEVDYESYLEKRFWDNLVLLNA